jgi:hypothetical chaperone protein
MMTYACGLDFGTSNSTIGIMQGNRAALLRLDDQVAVPSAIFYNYDDGQTYFGTRALEQYVAGTDGRLMRSLKSVLGTSLMGETTQLKDRRAAFADIMGAFLAHLKKAAEAQLGAPLDRVVVGRPVRFVDDDAAADAKAQEQLEAIVRKVGFTEVAFQYEPIAAAYEYELSDAHREGIALVIDIGGGTADFSILHSRAAAQRDRAGDILGTHGVHVGGTDIDRLVALEKIMPLLGYRSTLTEGGLPAPSWIFSDLATWHRVNTLYTYAMRRQITQMIEEADPPDLLERLLDVIEHRKGHYLLASAEAMKVALTANAQANAVLDIGDERLATTLTRAAFAKILAPWLKAIGDAIAETLRAAQMKPGAIQSVFLTGGTTLSPPVQALVQKMFADAAIVTGDSLGSVGLGLAIDASRRFS